MITAVTVLKSGGVFTPDWVSRLNRQIGQHLAPDRIVCLTDMDPMGYPTIPLKHSWPGWFSKMELFKPGILSGICVYFDLDTLIVGRLPRFEFEDPKSNLLLLNDLYRPSIPASGMMIWDADAPECEAIYHQFAANPKFSKRWSEGDGFHIGKHPHTRIQNRWPGMVGSYKANGLTHGPKDFSVVAFHGTPKQIDLPENSWAYKAWVGQGVS